MIKVRDLLAIFGVAIILIVIGAMALAIVPPKELGAWVKVSVCSLANKSEDHEALLARIGTVGEIWVRETAVVGIQDALGKPGCASIHSGNGRSFYVYGKADDLVQVFQ